MYPAPALPSGVAHEKWHNVLGSSVPLMKIRVLSCEIYAVLTIPCIDTTFPKDLIDKFVNDTTGSFVYSMSEIAMLPFLLEKTAKLF